MTEREYEWLALNGPRRDIPLLAEVSGGELVFRTGEKTRSGLRAKLLGPQIRHAWDVARRAPKQGSVFADGEHVGFPLAGFLALRGKRRVRLTVLGHYVDKRWKRGLLRLATRCVPSGTLVLHSRSQAEALRPLLPAGWNMEVLPYQVDSVFWDSQPTEPTVRPLVVSAGSENRDYQTLIEAARGVEADFWIASGSHWAREQATAADLPKNVRFITDTLSFAALRDLYAKSSAVLVPLHAVGNQSGITTILEGMSMAKPVIVSATAGQREAVTGHLVASNGTVHREDRGPHLIGLAPDGEETGLYVPVGDVAALRNALGLLLSDPALASRLGKAARKSVERNFTVEQFALRFAALLTSDARPLGNVSSEATPA